MGTPCSCMLWTGRQHLPPRLPVLVSLPPRKEAPKQDLHMLHCIPGWHKTASWIEKSSLPVRVQHVGNQQSWLIIVWKSFLQPMQHDLLDLLITHLQEVLVQVAQQFEDPIQLCLLTLHCSHSNLHVTRHRCAGSASEARDCAQWYR